MTTTISSAHDLNPAETRHLTVTDSGVHLIDVRTPAEFAGVHIDGSHNLPLDRLGSLLGDIANTSCPIVLVCKSGARSSQAQQQLSQSGRTGVRMLTGGVDAWQAAGEPVIEGRADVWALDRQVRLAAGSLVLAGMAMSIAAPKAKWLSGAIGAGLTFSAVSNTCAMGNALARLPYNQAADTATDIDAVVASLRSAS